MLERIREGNPFKKQKPPLEALGERSKGAGLDSTELALELETSPRG